jgi:hypothetical protein
MIFRKKVSLFNFENRYVTKMVLSWLLWTSLPIDSDKVVYAIAKTLPIRKNLKRNEIHLAELTKSTEFSNTYSTAHDIKSPVNNMLF